MMACANPTVFRKGSAPNSCGRCKFCKLASRKGWLFRLTKEAERWDFAYFITLTYDNDSLPVTRDFVDVDTGEVTTVSTPPTLVKSAMQKFFKRLRFNTKADLRYFAVGEYGSRTSRPHYHAILYTDLDFALRFSHLTRERVPLFRSAYLEQSWPFGFCSISELTVGRIGYTLKYITKTPKVIRGTEPQFKINSNYLGNNVFTPEMVDFWFSDPSNFYIRYDGQIIPMPKYFKDALLKDDPVSDFHDVGYRQLISAHLNSVVEANKHAKFLEWTTLHPDKDNEWHQSMYSRVSMDMDSYSFDTSVL